MLKLILRKVNGFNWPPNCSNGELWLSYWTGYFVNTSELEVITLNLRSDPGPELIIFHGKKRAFKVWSFIILSLVLVTKTRVWIGNWIIGYLQVVTTYNYNTIAHLQNLQ
jgi:hypothetical protein